jgi:hypothetical protein
VSNRTAGGQLRTVLALLTIATLLAMPFSAFGAKGVGLQGSITALGTHVVKDGLAAFEVQFHNGGTSTITQFQFKGSITNAQLVWASVPCTHTDEVTCVHGSLAAEAAFEAVLVFQANGNGGVTLSGEFRGDAKRGGSGAKVDTWPAGEATVLLGIGSSIYASWQLELEAEFGLDAAQVTNVSATGPAPGYFTMLQHLGGNLTCTSGDVTGTVVPFGQIVDLNVANGAEADIVIEITFAPQPGLSAKTVRIVHENDGHCVEVPRCPGTGGDCFNATTIGSGNSRQVKVTIYIEQNGRFGGF